MGEVPHPHAAQHSSFVAVNALSSGGDPERHVFW